MKLIYEFLASQVGTDAPTVEEIQNDLGGEVVWAYAQQGLYFGTLPFPIVDKKEFNPIYNLLEYAVEDFTLPSYARLDISTFGEYLVLSSSTIPDVSQDSVLNKRRFRVEFDLDLANYTISPKEEV